MSQDAKLLQHQKDLEHLYAKNQLFPRIKQEFIDCKDFNFSDYFEVKNIPEQFGYSLLVQMVLHKRCQLPVLVGVMNSHLQDAQQTTDMLLVCAEADLVDWNPQLKLFIVKFDISADVQEELDRYQFPLPLVVEPKKVKRNQDVGYLTFNGSLLLRDNHHEHDICLDHINRLNKIPLAIEHRVATMVKNQWKNLDKPKVGETREDFQMRKKAFLKYDRTAHEVLSTVTQLTDKIHLTHKYDKRLRTYACGYVFNYQGNAWNKACVILHNKELVE